MNTTNPPIDPPSFDYVRQLVLTHAAIALEDNKAYLVESRLMPLVRQHGLATLAELVARLRAQPHGELHAQVIEAMTTNETSFFRDLHPFEALKSDVLPDLIQRRCQSRTLHIWSAACSSGQEPYSIAMLLVDDFPQLAGWQLKIFASDLAGKVLEKAESGCYTQSEVNRGLPAPLLVKHFQRNGVQWQVKSDIRKLVQFFRINLIQKWPPLPQMDVVFVRNVLIYFPLETKKQILRNMRQLLAPDGRVFLGGAETTLGVDEHFERVNHGKTSSYRLTACSAVRPVSQAAFPVTSFSVGAPLR